MAMHWMIPIMAFTLVPLMLLVVAIVASVFAEFLDWLTSLMCGGHNKD